MTQTLYEDARMIAREMCARRADADGAHHTAECYRSGKWDDNSEFKGAMNAAFGALLFCRSPDRYDNGETLP